MTNANVLIALSLLTALLLVTERFGAPLTLQLSFKGDLKRESRWFAQYGQGACAMVIALLLWRLDSRPVFIPLLLAVFLTALLAVMVKRTLGRVRPGREDAGSFMGPTIRHVSARESFPSSHTASAVAMTVVLAHFYPAATAIFWGLAVICAVLRYLMDAHWPSDITAGVALGYGVAAATLYLSPA